MVNARQIAARKGSKRSRAAATCLALALAAVCATSTTITPSDYHDLPRLAATPDCTRLCAFAAHQLGMPATASQSAVTAPRMATFEEPGRTKHEAARGAPAPAAGKPHAEVVRQTVAAAPLEPPQTERRPAAMVAIASEPITSRPVADHFDFTGAAILAVLAEFNDAPAGNEFADLPVGRLTPLAASELQPLQAAIQAAGLTAGRELKALPPQLHLTASLDLRALQPAKTPQVAGWMLIRTVQTEDLSEEADLTAVAVPLLPVQKPAVPPSNLKAPPRRIPQAKISRRPRPAPSATAKKAAPPPPETTSDRSWANKALFRDN